MKYFIAATLGGICGSIIVHVVRAWMERRRRERHERQLAIGRSKAMERMFPEAKP